MPATATAVAYNLTVPNPGTDGHLRVMPGDEPDTATSAINVRRGETIANASVVALDGARRIKVANALAGPAEVVLDVLGYYLPAEQGAGDRFVSLPPARVHDAALAAEGLVPAGAIASSAWRSRWTAGRRSRRVRLPRPTTSRLPASPVRGTCGSCPETPPGPRPPR